MKLQQIEEDFFQKPLTMRAKLIAASYWIAIISAVIFYSIF